MSRWWRFYDDAINDPKLLRLSDEVFRAWTTLLCIASKNGGSLPPADDIALTLRLKPTKVAEWITKLTKGGLLDNVDGVFSPHNWEGRQFQSDSSSSRVSKYREKRKAAGLPALGDYSAFRPALINRDGLRCVYCEDTSGLVVDHMTPIALGGTDHPDNLALACKSCNSGKAGRTPELAAMTVIVTSASEALSRYRDMKRDVTVTVTTPEQSIAEADSKQSRADASAPIDEDLKRRAAAVGAGVSAHFLSRQLPVPNLDRCLLWLTQGYAQGTILVAIETVLKRGTKPATLEYFDGAIRDAHAKATPSAVAPAANWDKVFVEVDTPEWAAHDHANRAAGGRGNPTTEHRIGHVLKTGWWFTKRVPDGYDEATGEKLETAEERVA